jgi:hypothetical protein
MALSIKIHLTPTLKGFVVGSLILNLITSLSFDHNLCISGLTEQCENTLCNYTSKPFQWYLGGPNWCLFSFSTKALNIQDSHTSATLKVGDAPPLVRACFIPEHTFLASCVLALHILSQTQC